MSVFTAEQKAALANDAVGQLSKDLRTALEMMVEQIDQHVSAQIPAQIAAEVERATVQAVSAQRMAFVDALREIRRLASVGPARAGAVWGELDALLVKLEAS